MKRKLIYLSILFLCAIHFVNAQSLKGKDFRIAVIPDIQYYTAQVKGGKVEMFRDQIAWIRKSAADSNIVYVSCMGDNVDNSTAGGDPLEAQWQHVKDDGGFYALEQRMPGYPEGIPYGLALGNHDQRDTVYHVGQAGYHGTPGLSPVRNTSYYYNLYFGADHFKGKSYYGGHANLIGKNNNDCHFDQFTVAGQRYIVVYIAYDNEKIYEDKSNLMVKWADSVIRGHPNAKAIVVSHGLLKGGPLDSKGQNPWNDQGLRTYEGLKANTNIIMFLCGHVNQGYREEIYHGHKIPVYMSDYQGGENGGNGVMRTFRINTVTDTVSISTFSPYQNK